MMDIIAKDTDCIPEGMYCYTPLGWNGWIYEINPCPYWEVVKDRPNQENGYCHYLGMGDWQKGGTMLLWDQVKCCNINED